MRGNDEAPGGERIFQRIAVLLGQEQGYDRARSTPATRLAEDTGMDGDDAWEFLERYEAEFGVDLSRFKFYHHFGPEGCNPFWLIVRPWWAKIEHYPITVEQLVDAARRGRWVFPYPDDPRYPTGAAADPAEPPSADPPARGA